MIGDQCFYHLQHVDQIKDLGEDNVLQKPGTLNNILQKGLSKYLTQDKTVLMNMKNTLDFSEPPMSFEIYPPYELDVLRPRSSTAWKKKGMCSITKQKWNLLGGF